MNTVNGTVININIMKKIKLSSEACCAICFTTIQFVCVVIACAFIFQGCGSTCDIIGCVGYFILASLVEVAKYKVVHTYYRDKVLEENVE
jgi:hypothetical protein